MSEQTIQISYLNDFIFCPVSIFFHSLDYETEKLTYQSSCQINGTAAHSAVDEARYSDEKNILQGITVYSEKYNLFGKIDVFNVKTGQLKERKKKIKTIYDGYIFQLYAQYFALSEMGYNVKILSLYSFDDNKTYNVALPSHDSEMLEKFNEVINNINDFDYTKFIQGNSEKCKRCIYEPLCCYSLNSEVKNADES